MESTENRSFALTPVTEFTSSIPEEYILEPEAIEEDLKRAITGEELLERLIPRIEKLFDTSIPEEYILEPEAIEEDLERAFAFEEFRDRSLEHIRELYCQKGK
jgi:hypothetical protein